MQDDIINEPTRRAMVDYLALHGRTRYAKICLDLNIRYTSALVFHIRKLEAAGIIEAERSSRRTMFALTPKGHELLAEERKPLNAVIREVHVA